MYNLNDKNLNKAVSVLQDMLKYKRENDVMIDKLEFKIGDDVFIARMPKGYKYSYDLQMNGERIRMAEDSTLCHGDGLCMRCGYCL